MSSRVFFGLCLLICVIAPSWGATRFRRQQAGNQPNQPVQVDGNGNLVNCQCLATPQHNPVCGTDGNTYGNQAKLECARRCGQDVQVLFYGVCEGRGK